MHQPSPYCTYYDKHITMHSVPTLIKHIIIIHLRFHTFSSIFNEILFQTNAKQSSLHASFRPRKLNCVFALLSLSAELLSIAVINKTCLCIFLHLITCFCSHSHRCILPSTLGYWFYGSDIVRGSVTIHMQHIYVCTLYYINRNNASNKYNNFFSGSENVTDVIRIIECFIWVVVGKFLLMSSHKRNSLPRHKLLFLYIFIKQNKST